jgi:hypothetical protein
VPVTKRRKQSPLSRLKNAVRGAQEKKSALERARGGAPPELLQALADWSVKTLKYNALKYLEPSELSELHAEPVGTQSGQIQF